MIQLSSTKPSSCYAPAVLNISPSSARSEEGLRSSDSLIKRFIIDHVPGIKRVSKGMIGLMERFVQFKKRNVKIASDAEVWIPATEMQSYVRDYLPFREACFLMKGYSNHLAGKCDLIVGYTAPFEDLFIALLKAQHQYQSLPLSPLYLVTKESGNLNHNYDLIGDLYPGADTTMYHQTDKSPRFYIWLQNLSKEDKKFVYEGCADLDITACHPTIFFKEVLKEQTDNPYMSTMVKQPEVFLQQLIEHKVYNGLYPHLVVHDERAAAKDARSRLFNLRPDGRHNKSGVRWYDELQAYIIDRLTAYGVSDAHRFFCEHERQIVKKAISVIGAEHVALLVHDGMIIRGRDGSVVAQIAQAATGYNWKWSRF